MKETASNRFTDMFEKTGVTDRKKSKKVIDFGDSLADDEGINATFRALHETSAPSPPLLVSIDEPVVLPVVAEDPLPVVITEKATTPTRPPMVSIRVKKEKKQGEQLTGLSTEQSDGRTNGRSIERTIEQTGDLANERAIERSVGQAQDGALERTNDQTDEQAVEHSNNLTGKQSVGHVQEQSVGHSKGRSGGQSIRSMWDPLTENQGRILEYLYEVAGGLTNVDTICSETVIAYGTVRKCIDVLLKEGYIISKKRFNGHAFNGFEYSMNNHLCSLYLAQVRGGRSEGQSRGRLHGQSVGQTIGLSDGRAITPFSSRFSEDLKPTTTETGVLNDPELRFWAGEGVTEKQVNNWMSEFQMSQDEIVLSLRYGRFDILERGDVQNSANWFYKILTKNGFYPRPANYRSVVEIRAEALLQQQKRDREAQANLEAIDFEVKFQEFLANKDASLYQELFSQVGNFAKEQLKSGDKMAAEIELKDLLKNYLTIA